MIQPILRRLSKLSEAHLTLTRKFGFIILYFNVEEMSNLAFKALNLNLISKRKCIILLNKIYILNGKINSDNNKRHFLFLSSNDSIYSVKI